MEEVKIVARVYYDTGPYSKTWPYIEVGFGDPRFREPVSFRFLDELPEGKGPTDDSLIPLEIRDQILKMASETPPLITGEEQKLGEKYLSVLSLAADSLPEEFSHQEIRTLLREVGVDYSSSQLERITGKLAKAGFLTREEKERDEKSGQFRPIKVKLTQKGLNFLGVNRG